MTEMTWELAIVIASLWVAAGMTAASVAYRAGRDGWHWMLVCAVAGPVSVLVVAGQTKRLAPTPGALQSQRRSPAT